MLASNDVLTNAFQLLGSIVRDAYAASGRPCVGASLKLRLRSGSYNSFDERRLGFLKFGDFLRTAERAGVVQLRPTSGGDIAVFPPGIPIPQSPYVLHARQTSIAFAAPSPEQSYRGLEPSGYVRVRPDLWNAFNSLSSAWVYDRANDIAYKRSQSGEGGEVSSVPPNVIQILPGRERVLGWMRSFATMQDPGTKDRLLATLEDNSGPFQFRNAVSVDMGLRKAWRRFHIQQVLAAIDAWANANQIAPKDVVTPIRPLGRSYTAPHLPESALATPTAAPAEQKPPQQISPSLTPRLASLVDQLIDELLRLRGTLQVTERKY